MKLITIAMTLALLGAGELLADASAPHLACRKQQQPPPRWSTTPSRSTVSACSTGRPVRARLPSCSFRRHQPPTLIVWGKNDHIFPPEGAYPYRRDLKHLELHLLDTGHFALEEDHAVIAELMRRFLDKHVSRANGTSRSRR